MKKTGFQSFRVRPEEIAEVKISEIQKGEKVEVREFDATRLGSGARTVLPRGGTQHDSRFRVNPLLRAPLHIEDEERQLMERRISETLAILEEKTRKEARLEGYEEGLKRGMNEARAEFHAQAKPRLEKLDALLASLESARVEIYKANERALIDLVFRIARTVLLREAKADRELVGRLAGDILERVGVRENITLRLSLEDKETLEMLRESLQTKLGALRNLNVEASSEVRGGGCMVETEWNVIDASIDTQLERLYEAMLGQPMLMGREDPPAGSAPPANAAPAAAAPTDGGAAPAQGSTPGSTA